MAGFGLAIAETLMPPSRQRAGLSVHAPMMGLGDEARSSWRRTWRWRKLLLPLRVRAQWSVHWRRSI